MIQFKGDSTFIELAFEQSLITSAERCTFLCSREDLRRVGERFAGGLALIDTLQTPCWLALPKATFMPVRK